MVEDALVANLYSRDGTTRHRRGRGRDPRPAPDARPGPLLPARLEPRPGAPPVRHGWARLPRLRERHRGHGARARPPAGDRRDPRPGRQADRTDQRGRLHGAHQPPSGRDRGDVPRAARFGDVPQLGLRGDRRRPEARASRHGPTRASSRSGAGSTGGRGARLSVTSSAINYRTGYEPLLPGVHLSTFPGRVSGVRGRRGGRCGGRDGRPADADLDRHPCVLGGMRAHRAGPGRGRLHAGAAGVPARAPGVLRRARDPAHRRRGPVWLRADRPHVGVRAFRDRAGRRRSGQGDRQRPAAFGDRVVARAPGALGPRRARVDVRREPRGLCGRFGGPGDHPRGAPGRERRRARGRAPLRARADRRGGRPDRGRARPGHDDRSGVRARIARRASRTGRCPTVCRPPVRMLACSCSPAGVSTRSFAGSRRSTCTAAEISEAVEIFGETLAGIPRA